MKTRAAGWSVLILACCVYLASPAFAAEALRMDKDQLRAVLGNPELVIIDVRAYTDWVFSSEKIKGAVRENYRGLEGWSAKYPKDKTIVLYCA
jgi:rhodanese-related sulfurtransferase